MPTKQISRVWARQLLVEEAASGGSSQVEFPILVVYEKLRQHLSKTTGLDGFKALASRALKLAKVEAPVLELVQLTADGSLNGFDELQSRYNPAPMDEVGVIVIAHLLGLFLTFLGEVTTQRLMHEVFPQIELLTPSVVSATFDGILQEVDHLREISETLESLAGMHPAAKDGLLLISANIRNTAALLDVFAIVKNAGDSVLGAEPHEIPTRYLM